MLIKEFVSSCLLKFNSKVNEGKHIRPWEKMTYESLLIRLKEEVTELEEAGITKTPEEVQGECVDVANFAWFIWQKCQIEFEKNNQIWIELPIYFQKKFDCWLCNNWATWRHRTGGNFCNKHKEEKEKNENT